MHNISFLMTQKFEPGPDGIDIPYRDPLWQDCFHLRLNWREGAGLQNAFCDEQRHSDRTGDVSAEL